MSYSVVSFKLVNLSTKIKIMILIRFVFFYFEFIFFLTHWTMNRPEKDDTILSDLFMGKQFVVLTLNYMYSPALVNGFIEGSNY